MFMWCRVHTCEMCLWYVGVCECLCVHVADLSATSLAEVLLISACLLSHAKRKLRYTTRVHCRPCTLCKLVIKAGAFVPNHSSCLKSTTILFLCNSDCNMGSSLYRKMRRVNRRRLLIWQRRLKSNLNLSDFIIWQFWRSFPLFFCCICKCCWQVCTPALRLRKEAKVWIWASSLFFI